MSGSEKRKEKKENISFDTAKAVGYSVYDIPFAKGSAADEFAKGSIQFDGVSINETTPAKALIEKGWKSKYLDEYNKKETTISAEKSDMRIDLRVDGTISSTDQLTEKHVIQEIFAADESLEALTFASGVNGTSTLQDVYQVLGKPMSVRYSKNGVRVRYRTESNTAVSMSFMPRSSKMPDSTSDCVCNFPFTWPSSKLYASPYMYEKYCHVRFELVGLCPPTPVFPDNQIIIRLHGISQSREQLFLCPARQLSSNMP